MGEMGKIAKSSEKRKAGKDGSSESQSTEERPRGTEFRPDSPGELGQQQVRDTLEQSGRALNSHLRKEFT